MNEKYDQLKQSFDTLLKEHQRLLGRFVGLRRAMEEIRDFAATFDASRENMEAIRDMAESALKTNEDN